MVNPNVLTCDSCQTSTGGGGGSTNVYIPNCKWEIWNKNGELNCY
jgi:hypothetical protein